MTSAPHVKDEVKILYSLHIKFFKILNADILKPPQRVHQELVNEDTGKFMLKHFCIMHTV